MTTTATATRGRLPQNQPQDPAIIAPTTAGPRMQVAQSGAATSAVTKTATGLSLMIPHSMTVAGKPAFAVAAISAGTLVF